MSGLATTSVSSRWAVGAAACAGLALFHFLGNASHGYIATDSLFVWWGWQWFNPGSEAEHGPLILAVAGWLFIRNLGRGRAEAFGWSARRVALLALGGGLGLHLLGYAAQQARLSILGLLLYTWGILYLAGGARWGRAAVFPLAFLIFALPLNFLDSLGFYLRLWVAQITEQAAGWVGWNVIRNGTQLVSADGSYHYDVAAACSGVRSLIALTALSCLAGYLFFAGLWARLLLLGAAVPFALAGNLARIAAIVLAAEWWGEEAGLWVHDGSGLVVFAVVSLLLFGSVRFLQARGAAAPAAERVSADVCEGVPDATRWGVAAAAVGMVCVVALGQSWLARWEMESSTGVVLSGNGVDPAPLPGYLSGGWVGERVEVSIVEREILPAGTGFSRMNYVRVTDPSEQVFISIVLSGADRTSIHRPELCLVGQGWTIAGGGRHRFEAGEAAELPATLLQIRREVAAGENRLELPGLFAYWFVSADRVVASNIERMFWLAWDRLVRHRNHRWAYVVAQTHTLDGEEEAMLRMQEVVRRVLPFVHKPSSAGD